MFSTHHERPAGVPESFQLSEYPVSASSSQRRDVLKQQPRHGLPAVAQLLQDSHDLEEEAAAGSVESDAFAGDADVLAGEAAGEQIDPSAKSKNV